MTRRPRPRRSPPDLLARDGAIPGRRGLLLGLVAAATLGGARLALASPALATGDARLAVVLLRGAMDGLHAVQPYADPLLAALRGPLALPEPGRDGGLLDLGGGFGLHPALAGLHAMFAAGDALAVHAAAGPYRTRSHFDAQDLLEGGADAKLSSGWLNRALLGLPGPEGGARPGLAVGLDLPLLLRGPAAVGMYAPRRGTRPDGDLYARLLELNHADPLLGPAVAEGLRARGFAAGVAGDPPGGGFAVLAAAAGRLLASRDGPRVAALEVGGWDTHAAQLPRMAGALRQLDDGLAALRDALGPAWRRTAVLVVTEFGRTARVNGNEGTDHGTASAALVLGGAVAGGRVAGDWPGLRDLLDDRDLRPTTDLRALAKALLRDHLRLSPEAVARAFPGSETVAPAAGLLAT